MISIGDLNFDIYFHVANNWDQPFYTQLDDNIERKYSLLHM